MNQMFYSNYCREKVPVYRMVHGTIAWIIFIIVKASKLHNSNTVNVLFPRDLVPKLNA